MKLKDKLIDFFHRSRTETEGDAPAGFESEVMLVRDSSTGEIRRVEAPNEEGNKTDASDA